jgi:hypothetical protein
VSGAIHSVDDDAMIQPLSDITVPGVDVWPEIPEIVRVEIDHGFSTIERRIQAVATVLCPRGYSGDAYEFAIVESELTKRRGNGRMPVRSRSLK